MIYSETQFYTVVKEVGDKVQLVNDTGENIVVTKDYIEKCLISAEKFEKEEKLTRTEVVALFIANPYTAMTVCFLKQVKEADVVKSIQDIYDTTAPKDINKVLTKTIKDAIKGEERVIKGRHSGFQDDFGRYAFIDMEQTKDASKEYDTRSRLIDPRTIQWVIIRGVKYNVK